MDVERLNRHITAIENLNTVNYAYNAGNASSLTNFGTTVSISNAGVANCNGVFTASNLSADNEERLQGVEENCEDLERTKADRTELEELEDTVELLDQEVDTKADKDHTHDERYSPLNHTHSEYAKKAELEELADDVMDELSTKAEANHLHDEIYSPLGHTHSSFSKLYITKTDVDDRIDISTSQITVTDTNISQAVQIKKDGITINGKKVSTEDHTHNYSPLGHTHDIKYSYSFYPYSSNTLYIPLSVIEYKDGVCQFIIQDIF